MTSDSPLSTLGMGLDPRAEIFVRGDCVLRAIRPGHETFYRSVLEQPAIRDAMRDGLLIDTRIADEAIDGFALVLAHPRIAPMSFPFEWTPSMFQAAAAAVLELNARLMRAGFCTVDGHPWNILFDGARPVFVDFTSIVALPRDGRWPEALEFYRTCISALRLMEKGYPTPARALLREVREGPDPTLANAVLMHGKRFEKLPAGLRELRKAGAVAGHFAGKVARRFRTGSSAAAPLAEVEALLAEVRAMRVSPADEMWSDYYDGRSDVGFFDGTRASLDDLIAKSPKYQAIDRLLDRLKPSSVLDVACNRGPFSQLAALKGARAIGIDTDEAALDAMFRDTQKLGTRVTPLWCNFVTPAEPITFRQRPFPDVAERLRSDCVLCLALVHHLVFKGFRLNFEHVAAMLSELTAKHLIVEFVPTADRALADFLKTRDEEFRARFAWYSLENFKTALGRHFASIEELPSFPEPRALLVCTRA